MGWNNELALQLIDEYEKHPILWNAKNENHFSNKKADAWDAVAHNLTVEVYEIKRKGNSLLGSFRREKAKGKKSIGTGKGRHEIYISKWFAFNRMSFLLDKDEPRTTMHTDTEEAEDDLDSQLNENDESLDIQSPSTSQPTTQQTQPTQRIDSPAPQKKKQKKSTLDPRLEEAYQIMKTSLQAPPPDSCAVYGQHVANKLKTYSKNTQTEVEHAINNILYNADKGLYDRPAPPRPHFTDSVHMHYGFMGQQILSPSSSSTPPYTISTNPTPTPTAQNMDMPDLGYSTL